MSDAAAPQTIALVRENDVDDDRLRETYKDIKHGFRVPIVVETIQAWAAVPRFLELVWRRLRPNVLSLAFIDGSRSLGATVDRTLAAWPVGDDAATLRSRGVGETDLRHMREIVEMFFVMDHKLIVLAHAVRLALDGEDIGGAGVHNEAGEREHEEPDYRGLALPLTEERDAAFRVRSIFESLKSAAALPYVPSEYRAIARYPDWLEVWWNGCKAEMARPRYRTLRDESMRTAVELARRLPYRVRLGADIMLNYKIADADRRRLIEVTRTLCDALSALCVSVAMARRGLLSPA